MNNKYKKIIENADDFSAVLMTQNGFPVYDIMSPTKPGYCSASGLAFYVEDEKVLKEFEQLHEKERKEFLIANTQYVQTIGEIFKASPEMRHPMPLVYNHLLYAFEDTVKKGNYGCTHLLEDGKLLVFHQGQVFNQTGYKIDTKKPFNDLYDEIENLVAKAYKAGKIMPEGEISGKALDRLKSKNPVVFKQMSKHQNKTLDVLKSFKHELLDSCQLTYDKEEDLVVHIKINQNSYDVTVPKTAKEAMSYSNNSVKQEFKNIHDLIVSLYSEVSNKKLNNFISKAKI